MKTGVEKFNSNRIGYRIIFPRQPATPEQTGLRKNCNSFLLAYSRFYASCKTGTTRLRHTQTGPSIRYQNWHRIRLFQFSISRRNVKSTTRLRKILKRATLPDFPDNRFSIIQEIKNRQTFSVKGFFRIKDLEEFWRFACVLKEKKKGDRKKLRSPLQIAYW